jgi:hypothetical protein
MTDVCAYTAVSGKVETRIGRPKLAWCRRADAELLNDVFTCRCETEGLPLLGLLLHAQPTTDRLAWR